MPIPMDNGTLESSRNGDVGSISLVFKLHLMASTMKGVDIKIKVAHVSHLEVPSLHVCPPFFALLGNF